MLTECSKIKLQTPIGKKSTVIFVSLSLMLMGMVIPCARLRADGPSNCGLHVLNDFRNLCQGTTSSVCLDSPGGMDNGFMMGNLWGLTGDFPGNFSSGQDLLDYAHQMPHNSYAPMSLTVDAGNAHWVGIFRDSSGNLWFRDPQAGINVPLTASSVHDLINQGYHLDGDLHLLPNPLPVKPLAKPAYDCADGLRTTALKPEFRRPPLEPPPSEAPKSGAGLSRRGIKSKGIGIGGKAVKGCGTAFAVFCIYQNTCRFARACDDGDLGGMGEAAWDQFGPPISPWEASRSYEEAISQGSPQGEAVAAAPCIMYGRTMHGFGSMIATGAECVFGWTAPRGSKAMPGVWSPWRECEQ